MEHWKICNLADRPAYVEEVSRWFWEEWDRRDGMTLEEVTYRTRHALGRDQVPQMLVAERDGQPVGAVSLWRSDLGTRQDLTPWLATLYVRADCRGQHLGQALQQACIQAARALGQYDFLYLKTEHENYYERTGWEFVEQVPTGTGETARVYRYDLRR